MAYFDGTFCPRYGEESLNKFSSPDPGPDPDHPRGGPSHGYNTSCVKTSSQSEQHLLNYASGQTDTNALLSHYSAGVRVLKNILHVIDTVCPPYNPVVGYPTSILATRHPVIVTGIRKLWQADESLFACLTRQYVCYPSWRCTVNGTLWDACSTSKMTI